MTEEFLKDYKFSDTYENPRGIPKVAFIENIADHVKNNGDNAEHILKRLSEQYSKYKLAEHRLIKTIANLEAKLPEIKKTLQTIQYLKQKSESESKVLDVNYGLTESVFVPAKVDLDKNVQKTKEGGSGEAEHTCHVWLGANVMVEYTFDEAINLLNKNFSNASENLKKTREDLSWLQEQQTILEVNTSRIYNYDVVRKRDEEKNKATAENK